MEESGPTQPQDSTVEAPPLTRGIDFTPSEDEERPAKVPRTEKPVPAANRPQILRSVVKVFVKRSLPNYAQPWQTQQQRSAVGSAFVIDTENRHILTNSHVVAHHITIHVRRPGHPKKWKASQLCEGKACDLALMTVEEDEFWEGIQAVKFLGVPELQQQITVTGYPIGGDSLSITQGIVSRVTMSPYTSGAAQLINIQIDAAINPGNSGGPAFANLSSSEVVGVAFSRHKQAEATGYIIPYIVVQHFMESFKRRGLFSGLCCLGILVNRLENPSLRRYHQLSKDQSGAVIKKISPLASATAVLSVDDVITHVNDQPVADDCTLTLRHDERISMMHAIRASHIGDEVHLDILRAGTPSRVSYPLNHCLYKIPGLHGVDCWPSYYIYGGMVFQPLSQPLLEHYYGRHVGSKAPPSLLAELSQFREHVDESIVVLSQVLAADVTFGYHCQFGRLNSVNGVDIMNIYQLADVCDNCTSEFVIFDLHPNDQVVLGREEVEATLPAVLEAHGIAEDRSKDVRDRSVLPRQAHGILAGTADLVEKPANGALAANTNAANDAPDAAAAAGVSDHAANSSAPQATSGAGGSAGAGGNGGNGGNPNGSGTGAAAPDSEMKECGTSDAGEGS